MDGTAGLSCLLLLARTVGLSCLFLLDRTKIFDTETIYNIVSIQEGKENSDIKNEDLINELVELDFFRTEFMDITCEHDWKKNSGLDSIFKFHENITFLILKYKID